MSEKPMGRLALREEAGWWKAYWAVPDTMDRAILLGQIRIKFVYNNIERKRTFMLLMQACMGDLVEEAFGQRPTWPEPPQPAPKHERKS